MEDNFLELDHALRAWIAKMPGNLHSTTFDDVVSNLTNIANRFKDPKTRIGVFGRFNSGKSTLINALLGKQVVPTDVVACTALGISISFGTTDVVRFRIDGQEIVKDGFEALSYFVADSPTTRFPDDDLVEVEVSGTPFPDFLEVMDLPGTSDEAETRVAIARRLMERCDWLIYVLDCSGQLTLEDKTELTKIIQNYGDAVSVCVTKADMVTGDQDKAYNKIVHDLTSLFGPIVVKRIDSLDELRRGVNGESGKEISELRESLAEIDGENLKEELLDGALKSLRTRLEERLEPLAEKLHTELSVQVKQQKDKHYLLYGALHELCEARDILDREINRARNLKDDNRLAELLAQNNEHDAISEVNQWIENENSAFRSKYEYLSTVLGNPARRLRDIAVRGTFLRRPLPVLSVKDPSGRMVRSVAAFVIVTMFAGPFAGAGAAALSEAAGDGGPSESPEEFEARLTRYWQSEVERFKSFVFGQLDTQLGEMNQIVSEIETLAKVALREPLPTSEALEWYFEGLAIVREY